MNGTEDARKPEVRRTVMLNDVDVPAQEPTSMKLGWSGMTVALHCFS